MSPKAMPQYICLFSNFGSLNLKGGELGKEKKKERERERKEVHA